MPPHTQMVCRFQLRTSCADILSQALRRSTRKSLGIAPDGEVSMSWDVVYRLVKRIPRGRVTTYGRLARALRIRGGARAVGYAMAACPSGRGIPWHRVVGAGGKSRMPEPQASLQRRLLESEGIQIENGVVDLDLHEWTPGQKSARVGARRKGASRRKRQRSRKFAPSPRL
jgi:methylated-DNA-protein-cysteine methyltransferase related protein